MKFPHRALWLVFVCSAFTSAGLLFLSEPMIGKLLLPLFGGSPAVWNTCIVFFQVLLLLGYAYAHWSVTKLGLRYQPWVHLVLVALPLLLLPIALPAWAGSGTEEIPIFRLLAILMVTVGAPFFILATSGPLLQRWFAATKHPLAERPYFLYAAGNLGSFVALLSYPFWVEPSLSLGDQQKWWSVGYGVFVALMAACVATWFWWHLRPHPTAKPKKLIPITWRQRGLWTFAAFIPSSLMLGVTTHITTDVAAVPLLWVVPLALYLLTFVVAFGVRAPSKIGHKVAPWAASGLFTCGLLMTLELPTPKSVTAVIYILVFTLIALVAHSRLALSRPAPLQLTEFYLWVAIGGALGGTFNGLLAPVIFNDVYEFPIALLLSLPLLVTFRKLRPRVVPAAILLALPLGYVGLTKLLLEQSSTEAASGVSEIIIGLGIAMAYIFYREKPVLFGPSMVPFLLLPIGLMALTPHIKIERTFYGVIKVQEYPGGHKLLHGVTDHGNQSTQPGLTKVPLTYYHHHGPMGDIFQVCREINQCRTTGMIGLGTGTLAAYGQTGDKMTFYEIDPAIVHIAQDPQYFTYLRDTRAKVDVRIGDGRLTLKSAPDNTYDMLVLDAFSSDAIPTHLLTREAIGLYLQKLASHGLMAIHISNRELNLAPIVQAAAHDQGLYAMQRTDDNLENEPGRYSSQWVVVGRQPEDIARFAKIKEWKVLQEPPVRVWTDDYSNIFDAMRLQPDH